jgi:uroporphyrin-III C-methyltransferase
MDDEFAPGTVWLVGAGPGDPDLLTRKAERLLTRADIVFHDALVGPGILALTRTAQLVSVGKRSGRHSRDQQAINALIVAAAVSGKRGVRLKGGDPSVFGRSAEELTACEAHGVPVRICPGVTAASAAAASGLASLTLRGSARQLTLLTAHACAGKPLDLDWVALARPDTTLAIYMGRAAAAEVANALIAAGLAPDTPVMVAVNVSLPTERLLRGRLDTLNFLVKAISNDDPTLLLVGDACASRDGASRNAASAPIRDFARKPDGAPRRSAVRTYDIAAAR